MKSTKSDNNTFRQTDLRDCLQQPMDVNGLTILLCTAGRAVLDVDFKQYAFAKGDLALIPEGMSLIPRRVSALFSVQLISIAPECIRQTEYKISNGNFWDYLFQIPLLRPSSEQFHLLADWFRQMNWVLDTCHTDYRHELISGNILSFFIMLHSELSGRFVGQTDTALDNHALQLMSTFSTHLSRHHHRHRQVSYYASLLSITPDYLNKLCHLYWKAGAKEVINAQVVMAIKNYLSCTDLPVKTIAAQLNFDDPSYMCRLFKRSTGCAPGEFRRKGGGGADSRH